MTTTVDYREPHRYQTNNRCSCGEAFASFGDWARHISALPGLQSINYATKHAVIQDRTIDAEGHVEERDFHYLTCKACKIENDANDLAIEITRLLRPDEFGKWKWQVERILKEYLVQQ